MRLTFTPSALTFAPLTRYPDVIESCPPPGSGQKHSHTIKSHHNVGGLPKDLQFTLIEPFRDLFKDEVRRTARLGNRLRPLPHTGRSLRVLRLHRVLFKDDVRARLRTAQRNAR